MKLPNVSTLRLIINSLCIGIIIIMLKSNVTAAVLILGSLIGLAFCPYAKASELSANVAWTQEQLNNSSLKELVHTSTLSACLYGYSKDAQDRTTFQKLYSDIEATLSSVRLGVDIQGLDHDLRMRALDAGKRGVKSVSIKDYCLTAAEEIGVKYIHAE